MEKSDTLNTLRELLRTAGYKATRGRIAVLELLRRSKRPLGIPEITARLKGASIDQATAYRILAMLIKIGAARAVDLRHGHTDYEFAHEEHHHLVCLSCGRIEDFKDSRLDILAEKIFRNSKSFKVADKHPIQFFGLCRACALKKL